ncbi:hypothetical protein [Desulfolutivibrio sulfodismutans]
MTAAAMGKSLNAWAAEVIENGAAVSSEYYHCTLFYWHLIPCFAIK